MIFNEDWAMKELSLIGASSQGKAAAKRQGATRSRRQGLDSGQSLPLYIFLVEGF